MIPVPALPGLLLTILTFQPLDLVEAPPTTTPLAFRQSTHAFRRLLPKLGYTEPIERWEELESDPANKLLILLGDTTPADQIPGGVNRFLTQGGSLLVATDRASRGLWTRQLGVEVSGRFVYYSRAETNGQEPDPEPMYNNGPAFPYVHAMPPSPSSDLFSGVPRLATNRPSFLQLLPRPEGKTSRLVPVARFVAGCSAQGPEEPLTRISPPPWFAAAAQWGNGRVLVLADHSVFINEMLLRQDNHNMPFAINCLTWLRGPVARSQVLFLEDGKQAANFEEPLNLPALPPEAVAQLINSTLRGFQEENVFNSALLDAFGTERPLLWALGLVTLILMGYGFFRLGKKRHRVEKETPQLPALLARQAASAALIDQRHQAMLAEGNLWEAARALARECFEETLGDGVQAERSLLAAEWGEPPTIHVVGGWWRRWQLGYEVRRLWQLAYDPVPVPVSPAEFSRLPGQVRAMRAALADGLVRIEPPAVKG